jgi:hypothetical protein
VPDVGDIHHMAHAVAVELERAAQRIDEDIRAHVAEMLRQINRRAARIKGHVRRMARLENLDGAGERIEDLKRFHGWLKPIAAPRRLTSHRGRKDGGQGTKNL